jgi:hypothetical protein
VDQVLVEQFAQAGFVPIRGALDPEWIDLLRELVPEMLATQLTPKDQARRSTGSGDGSNRLLGSSFVRRSDKWRPR